MEVEFRNNRRKSAERRKSTNSIYDGPERRKGKERRKIEEKLRHMIKQSELKNSAPAVRSQNPQEEERVINGNIIRRRRGTSVKTTEEALN